MSTFPAVHAQSYDFILVLSPRIRLFFDQLHLDRKKSHSLENLATLASPESVCSLPVPILLTPDGQTGEELTLSLVGVDNGGHAVALREAFATQIPSTVDIPDYHTYLNTESYSQQALTN